MDENVLVPLLSKELIFEALELAKPSIIKMFETPGFIWGPRAIAVAVVSDRFLSEPVTLTVGHPEQYTWDSEEWGDPKELPPIALWKATMSHQFGVPTSHLAHLYPHVLLRGGLYRYAGGVPGPLNAFSIGSSGAQGRGDEFASNVLIDAIMALAHTEVDAAVKEGRRTL